MVDKILKLTISSTAFEYDAPIPEKYTKLGKDVSPPLTISGTPKYVTSLAIIVDDPDAPLGDFVHWVAWNLDPDLKELKEGSVVPEQGLNDFGGETYQGPYPPAGKPHHYHFKVYALKVRLNLPKKSGKKELLAAMEGSILAQGELVGTFER